MQYGPDEDAAFDLVMSGLDAMAGGDYNGAIAYLQQAQNAYKELGDTGRVSELKMIITKAQTLLSSLQETTAQ